VSILPVVVPMYGALVIVRALLSTGEILRNKLANALLKPEMYTTIQRHRKYSSYIIVFRKHTRGILVAEG